MDIKDLINSLSEQDIIDVMQKIGAELIKQDEKQIIFTTICHNSDSHKLYYYKSSKQFYCYSRCNFIGDIISLIKKVFNINTSEAIHKLKELTSPYKSIIGFHKKMPEYKPVDFENIEVETLPTPKKPFLYLTFDKVHIKSWENEGISFETIKKFGIHYYRQNNQIVIPHFAWDSKKRVVGIRVRNLNEYDIENFGKYTPLFYFGCNYAHKLGLNLYGYNINRDSILKLKKVIIFEGEKSVLQMDTMFKNNPSVAVCGSNLTKQQKKILYDSNVEEMIIAFDKQFKIDGDEESQIWKNKIKKICEDIQNKIKISIIWDVDDLLDYKDSPTDKGKKIFNKLLKDRIDINEF